TGRLWTSGALHGKFAGVFVSTGTLGGGQETTALHAISTLTHHGIVFIPLGYKNAFASLANMTEVHGGTPWGSCWLFLLGRRRYSTPSELETSIAMTQGKTFWETVSKFMF
ncbi:benzoquinone reductase, partial [Sphaerobolus stellatus SS14]